MVLLRFIGNAVFVVTMFGGAAIMLGMVFVKLTVGS